MTHDIEPRPIANFECATGENPLWHPLEKRLYWCDIPAGRLFRYSPATGSSEQIRMGEQTGEGEAIGGFTFQENGGLLLFMARGAVRELRDGKLRTLIDSLHGESLSRFNDVIADPRGRVFCGTMSCDEHPGSLYRLDTDGSIKKVVEGVGCSNGLAFSLDRKLLYYTDSVAGAIDLFDYDEQTGEIGNRRAFARVREEDGLPDGLTMDAEGCLWSARWNGSRVVRYRPDGSIEREVSLPVRYVSSVAFGGDDMAELFITTARGTRTIDPHPLAGALFSAKPGIRGVPEFYSKIRS